MVVPTWKSACVQSRETNGGDWGQEAISCKNMCRFDTALHGVVAACTAANAEVPLAGNLAEADRVDHPQRGRGGEGVAT